MKVGPLSNFMNQVRDEPASPRSTRPWWSAWRVPLQLPLVVDAETMLQVRIGDLGLIRQWICPIYINRDLSVHGTFINNVSNDRLDLPLLKGMGELGEWWRQVFCRSLFVCASPRSNRRTSRNTGKDSSVRKLVSQLFHGLNAKPRGKFAHFSFGQIGVKEMRKGLHLFCQIWRLTIT